jgi:membrane fusion protein (multidrug efflux system)
LLDVEVRGRVKRVSPVIDPANGTFKVTIAVEGSAAGQVRPGMFVTIVIRTAIREGSLLIPRQAVLGDEGVRYVYLALEGTARRRDIRLGTVLESEVEVRSGLEEGHAVVVVGQHRLKPGSPVQVLK